jgi:prolipoprotein diacylglyceryltransferase
MNFGLAPANLFSVILGFGALIGLLRIFLKSFSHERIPNLIVCAATLIGCLFGSRVGFVIAHVEYYKNHLSEMAMVALGGLSWPGAIAGGLLFTVLYATLSRTKVGKTLDITSLMFLPLGSAAWLGAWTYGIAYGALLNQGTWWGVYSLDETGLVFLRVPVQLAAAITLFISIMIFEQLTKKVRIDGMKFGIIGLTFSVHSVVFSFMRVDPTFTWQGFRIDSIAGLILTMCFIVFMGIQISINRNKPIKLNPNPSQERLPNET